MQEWKWIRIENQYEAHRQYAQTLPTFNAAFGERSAFTYVVRDIPADEWDEIVRERRRVQYPERMLERFVEAVYAREVLSQPIHLIRLFQEITQIRQREPLSGTSGI
jgi:hypothetical protein